MSEIAIKVENLSKSYPIRKGEGARYTALRDVIAERAGQFFNHLKKGQNPFSQTDQQETFWALNDVSFEVKQGEVMGVIGRNGAGKSTLLKILSRITEPDKGRIALNGRVASLLEVGTGFHPELTGRENIYLSGAILGMRREEINKRFDEIVDFAGVEKFLDTPVKRYSSGMYVRLGFAVAAHLETEILLVDEVLAVGDMEFQHKCIEKMEFLIKQGKSLVLVSHNLGIIKQMSDEILILSNGKSVFKADASIAINNYINENSATFQVKTGCEQEQNVFFEYVRLINQKGEVLNYFDYDKKIILNFVLNFKIPSIGVRVVLQVLNGSGQIIFASHNYEITKSNTFEGSYEFQCELPNNFFYNGEYLIQLHAGIPGSKYLVEPKPYSKFIVVSNNERNNLLNEQYIGVVLPKLLWSFHKI